MTLKQIEVEDSIEIPFDWKDKTPGGGNLGRAAFDMCIRYSRGKVKDFFVYPRQQRLFHYWHHVGASEIQCSVNSCGVPKGDVWWFGWCKEHKTQTFQVYAPEGAGRLRIDCYGISFLPPGEVDQ